MSRAWFSNTKSFSSDQRAARQNKKAFQTSTVASDALQKVNNYTGCPKFGDYKGICKQSCLIKKKMFIRHSLVKNLDGSELDGPPPLRRASTIESPTVPVHHTARLTRRASLDDLEQESCQLTPKIDHRIIIITNKEVWILLAFQKKLRMLGRTNIII